VVYNLLGQPVFTERISETGYFEFSISLKSGIYIVSLETGGERVLRKIFIDGR